LLSACCLARALISKRINNDFEATAQQFLSDGKHFGDWQQFWKRFLNDLKAIAQRFKAIGIDLRAIVLTDA
jgi:hypothetical protein